MEIGRESEGEIREYDAGSGGVEVFSGRAAGDEAPEEADRNSSEETEEESEHRDRYSDHRRHCAQIQLHI